MKTCPRCKKEKDSSDFYYDERNWQSLSAYCRPCTKTQRAEYVKRNPERHKRNTLAWRENNLTRSNYIGAKAKAKHRGILFELSFSEYNVSVLFPCFYCGDSLPKYGCGLDRIDNNKGYVLGNVCACCIFCNQAKMNQTQSDFVERCTRIANIHRVDVKEKR